MLIDSHCHLDRIDLTPFDNNFANLMRFIAKQEVDYLLCVSVHPNSWQNMANLTKSYPNVFLSFGIHPGDIKPTDLNIAMSEYTNMITNPRVIAIGETGLDYHYGGDKKVQQEIFERQISTAITYQKPLIIHTRDAREDTITMLKSNRAENCGGVMHCFTEDWVTAKAALDLGFYISFSGILTFNNANTIRDVAKKIPLDRLLVETDSPYLTPMPYRGKPNNPSYVTHVAQKLSDIKAVSFEKISEITSQNFQILFKLKLD